MEKFVFVSAFRNLSIKDRLEDPFTLLPGVDISNLDAAKQDLLDDDQIVSMIGLVEADHLINSPNIVFCEFEKDDLLGDDIEASLVVLLMWVKSLFRSAWVLFDHNMDCESAYLLHYVDDKLVRCTSNFLAQRSTRADCTFNDLSLTLDDLRRWEEIHHRIESYLHTKQSGSPFRFLMEKGYCRSARALQFVESARASPNVGFKVAHYVSAFEALVSTSSAELSHRLSERVAFLLGNYGHSRAEVFREMRRAYDIRSKLVHGDSLSQSKIETISEASRCCDAYLREIMQLMFGDEDLKAHIDVAPQAIDRFFEKMILGE